MHCVRTAERVTMRTYRELILLPTFEERFEYLKLNGGVSNETFGFDRMLNQVFYKSPVWEKIRREVILRDNGCDLGIPGFEVQGKVLVHHMNPISIDDLLDGTDILMDPNYLITVSHDTHNAIHYGTEPTTAKYEGYAERTPGDTLLWRK